MVKQVLTFMLVLLSLAGCSSSDEAAAPSTATFSLVADDHMNLSVYGESSPIELQVFELVDDSMFMSADFDQINQDYKKVLKSNYIEVYDYVLTPGQFKLVDGIELDEDTRYIAVLAKFAEPELSEWKKAVKVISQGRIYHLLIMLKENDVKLQRVE